MGRFYKITSLEQTGALKLVNTEECIQWMKIFLFVYHFTIDIYKYYLALKPSSEVKSTYSGANNV